MNESGAGKRTVVLVVEDTASVRNALSVILENRGYEVITAVDGEQALSRVPLADVVLLDLRLPKVDGEEFLKRIRAVGNYVPVIVMSAYMGRKEGLERLRDYQIVDFVEKPFTLDFVTDKIQAGAKTAEDMKAIEAQTGRLRAFIQRQQQPLRPLGTA